MEDSHEAAYFKTEAQNTTDTCMDEHDYAPDDWGSPGKNHNTENKWDD